MQDAIIREVSINSTKENIKEYLVERGWDDMHPADIAKSIVIESAELLEIFQWDRTRKNNKISKDQLLNIKKELADVLIYCFEMGIILNLDLEKIIEEKLVLVKEKYPVQLFNKKSSTKKDTTKLYSNIKQIYRKQNKK